MSKLKLKPEMIKWKVEIQPEDRSPKDEFDDERDVAAALKAWKEDDYWGWGVVKVTGEFMGLTESAFMGGCTYRDEEQFIRDGYSDMQSDVMYGLQEQIEAIADLWESIRHN